jgi:hypothetical protein
MIQEKRIPGVCQLLERESQKSSQPLGKTRIAVSETGVNQAPHPLYESEKAGLIQ